ncbi:hypothetical protein E2562_032257 [Oryza meyeriana var. granulata]|uniref:Uncharacterized protein n=1 Tax=Oryza meyeriana var. granulata TaxID=110450 RepID=A0A6G1D9Y5_9ORYZ|nr:hypothetical protein E2562_032257 [Oryza meyeriana var. granulata]
MLCAVANIDKWKVARAAAWYTPTLAARPFEINVDHLDGLVKPRISEGWTLLRQATLLATGCNMGVATSSGSAVAAAANGLPFWAMHTPTAWGRGHGKIEGHLVAALLQASQTKTMTAAADMKHRTLMASLRRLAVAAAHMRALAMEWILCQLRSPKMSLQRLVAAAAQIYALAMDMEWLMRLLMGLKTSPKRLAIEAAWKRLLKVWFGNGTIMGPRPSSGSATNGDPNIFDDLAGAESVGADAHVVLKALDKLVSKMEKIS